MEMDTKLRDSLAIDRTAMANERILLSYGRTVLGLVGVAAIIFKFADPFVGILFGSLMLSVAFIVSYIGIRSYRLVAEKIRSDDSKVAPEDLELSVEEDRVQGV